MKIKRSVTIIGCWLLLSTSLLHAQDLSKYRTFALGANTAQIIKQAGERPSDLRLISKEPALLQELAWWPLDTPRTARPGSSAQKILFSFYNDKLYRFLVTYDNTATKGLTDEDMVQGLSAQYGPSTASTQELKFPTGTYPAVETAIRRWDGPADSIYLFRFSLDTGFGLLFVSKQTDAAASDAIAEAATQTKQQASQAAADSVKKENDDLETTRQKNLKNFQP